MFKQKSVLQYLRIIPLWFFWQISLFYLLFEVTIKFKQSVYSYLIHHFEGIQNLMDLMENDIKLRWVLLSLSNNYA